MVERNTAADYGRAGGKASAANMTAEQRITRAKNASKARKLKCECGKPYCLTCYRRRYKKLVRARKSKGVT